MKLHTISIQGVGEWNEDAFVLDESRHIFGVIDGATSLVPYRGANGETGGRLASQCIKHFFEELTDEDETRDLEALTLEANRRLGREMAESGVNLQSKEELWTAGLAMIRVSENRIEFVQAGDCMILAKYRDGSMRSFTRDHVAHIDRDSKKIWEAEIASGVRSKAALWEKVKPIILGNKKRMNTPEGYSVLNGLPEAGRFLEYGRMNRIGLDKLLLVTDGLFYPEESQEQGSRNPDEQLLNGIEMMGLEPYAQWLIALEEEDAECIRYPRFKKSDDKTGIWIEL